MDEPVVTRIQIPADGKLVVGHLSEATRNNQDVVIPAQIHRPPAWYVDAYCHSCPAKSELDTTDQGSPALMVIHADDCPELARLLALATTPGRG